MKRIQGVVMAMAFVFAIGGAFASNLEAFNNAYRSDGCTSATKPVHCTSTNLSDPDCTIGAFTYYQDASCLNSWHIPQP